ncbi:MAG: hypothetical protein ACJA2D_001567 [Pseudohongiellaceae bacterium]|jgi:hypothetical protein
MERMVRNSAALIFESSTSSKSLTLSATIAEAHQKNEFKKTN